MNKLFYLLTLFMLQSASVIGEDVAKVKCNPSKCPPVSKHYEELGCEPVRSSEDDCCVRSFNCPDLKTRDLNKCFYKNETYSIREQLPERHTVGSCNVGCYCAEGHSDSMPAEFMCASLDCPEEFGYGREEDMMKKCVKQYDREHCCATKTVCDDNMAWASLATCEYGGRTYMEGEKIYPENECFNCFCTKNFTNETALHENPACQKIDCGISLRNVARLFDGCVPMYYKVDNCCPIGWKCPEDEHMEVNKNFTRRNSIDPVCKFGSLEFNIGEELVMEGEECQKCTCNVPPMLTCIDNC